MLLPIEFCRISADGRLTLAIDETFGALCRTYSAPSGLESLDEAIENLRLREGMPNARAVGFVEPASGQQSDVAMERHPEAVATIAAWAASNGYNAALCNLYRNGNDSVGLHADAEPEMGPIIASVSLGAERMFRLKRHDGSVALSQRLPHGSLLIMAGATQKHFQHEVPKEPHIIHARINLTFRRIEHKSNLTPEIANRK